jgi:hypothetical protein
VPPWPYAAAAFVVVDFVLLLDSLFILIVIFFVFVIVIVAVTGVVAVVVVVIVIVIIAVSVLLQSFSLHHSLRHHLHVGTSCCLSPSLRQSTNRVPPSHRQTPTIET